MADDRWTELRRRLQDVAGHCLGRVEYGNLRIEAYDGNNEAGGRIAVAYETPGGSTNQFGISFEDGEFHMLDAKAEQVLRFADPGEAVERMRELIESIPAARAERLRQDIDQMLISGSGRADVLQELNRLLRLGTEFRGGSLTTEELTEACRYLVRRTLPAGG